MKTGTRLMGGWPTIASVSPVAFTFKEKQFIVAPARDGRIALLDAASLGGADHHTPLFETPAISKAGEKHGWDGFATWQDKDGTAWVFASISAAISLNDNATKVNSSNPHGGVVAFKVEDTDGKFALTPVWVSPDMINPAPPQNCERCVGRSIWWKLRYARHSLRFQCSDRREAIFKRESNSYVHRTFRRRRCRQSCVFYGSRQCPLFLWNCPGTLEQAFQPKESFR